MIITPPQQALCANRRQLTQGPNPDRWLVPALPSGWSLHSFHFFVNWTSNPLLVGQEVWMTRLVHSATGEALQTVSAPALEKTFASSTDASALESLGRFCSPYGQRVRAVLLPELPATSVRDDTTVWTIPYRTDGRITVEVRTLGTLKAFIQQESGGSVKVGCKGLTFGTSAIECVLSHTDSAYPGDVDAVVFDSDGIVRCVVEYKKHTLISPLGEHLITRYYPSPDGRKYQRLNALVSHYRRGSTDIPFVVLYYSTKSPMIRLQLVRELLPERVIVGRDSGDWSIVGMTENQVAMKIIDWLGIA